MNRVDGFMQSIHDACSLVHRKMRPFLPTTKIESNNVVHGGKLGDSRSSQVSTGKNDYERGALRFLREHVENDDHVVIIGGGYGVTPLFCSRHAEKVSVFEPSQTMRRNIQIAFAYSDDSNVSVMNQAFYDDSHVYHGEGGTLVTADVIPPCDVLEIDCEGVENHVLEDLQVRPRVIIVERHGCYDVSKNDLVESLNDYEVKGSVVEYAQNDIETLCFVEVKE